MTLIGPLNIPADVPLHASQMYSKNVFNFVALLVKDGELHLDLEDEIIQGSLVAHGGKIVHSRVAEALDAQRAQGV